MILTSNPGNRLRGEITLPGDKSLSHRAALFAALAGGESRIDNFLVAGVTQAMLGALTSLGVAWELKGNVLHVRGRGLEGLAAPAAPLDCGNSATTLRLLAGALAASGLQAELDGLPGLRRRPMMRIVDPLRAMGVPILTGENGGAPLTLAARPEGRRLKAIDYKLPVASAQVKSCLLLAALAGNGPTLLREPGPSRDHTERMLGSMGASLDTWTEPGGAAGVRLRPAWPVQLSPLSLRLPADISAAAFLIVAALITPGSRLVLRGVGLNPTRTGLIDALQGMGADLRIEAYREEQGEPAGDLIVQSSGLRGVQISGSTVVRMIDEFPVFAIAAACAQGPTVVCQAEELRYKESDRISALCGELRQLGVGVQETLDGFILAGGGIPGGARASAHGDHRLAMSLAVAGLAAGSPVQVDGAEMIAESFPEFIATCQSLGADLQPEPEVSSLAR